MASKESREAKKLALSEAEAGKEDHRIQLENCELCVWLDQQLGKVQGADSQVAYAVVLKTVVKHREMFHLK